MKHYLLGLVTVLVPVAALFGQAPAPAQPTAEEVQALREELARTKAELAALKKQTGQAAPVPAAPTSTAANGKAAGNKAASTPGIIPAQLPMAPDQGPLPEQPPANGNGKANGNGDGNGDEKKEEEPLTGWFGTRFLEVYLRELRKPMPPVLDKKWREEMNEKAANDQPWSDDMAPRRGLGQSSPSPPFPNHEWQGYPLPGVPPEPIENPFMKALYGADTPFTDAIKHSRVKFYGWVTGSANASTAQNSNTPDSYWIVPNRVVLDQAVFRLERELDSVQTDHWDVGFRTTAFYGIDYRYTVAGGWGSDQLFKNNKLNGWDPLENYVDIYNPNSLIGEGSIFRIGRWVACPDIETQLAPDNYLGSHSILFTYDTYTQTGFMHTIKLNDNWTIQGGINAGNDMAPWHQGAVVCGYAAARWTSSDNNNAVYGVLNQIDTAKFRHFTNTWGEPPGTPSGHDNFNYYVMTYEHRFNACLITKFESYFMWQRDAELGGTPTLGPVGPWLPTNPNVTPGTDNPTLPGISYAYGVLNYTMFATGQRDYITLRNEWWRDERGMRSGFPGNYTSHTIGWSHQFNDFLMVRPEIGYYRNWNNDSFDLGTHRGVVIAGADLTFRF
jgi:hypothetical protein